jgi:hypothetical protein
VDVSLKSRPRLTSQAYCWYYFPLAAARAVVRLVALDKMKNQLFHRESSLLSSVLYYSASIMLLLRRYFVMDCYEFFNFIIHIITPWLLLLCTAAVCLLYDFCCVGFFPCADCSCRNRPAIYVYILMNLIIPVRQL